MTACALLLLSEKYSTSTTGTSCTPPQLLREWTRAGSIRLRLAATTLAPCSFETLFEISQTQRPRTSTSQLSGTWIGLKVTAGLRDCRTSSTARIRNRRASKSSRHLYLELCVGCYSLCNHNVLLLLGTQRAVNGWYGMYLLGLSMNDENIQDLGATLLMTELRSAKR